MRSALIILILATCTAAKQCKQGSLCSWVLNSLKYKVMAIGQKGDRFRADIAETCTSFKSLGIVQKTCDIISQNSDDIWLSLKNHLPPKKTCLRLRVCKRERPFAKNFGINQYHGFKTGRRTYGPKIRTYVPKTFKTMYRNRNNRPHISGRRNFRPRFFVRRFMGRKPFNRNPITFYYRRYGFKSYHRHGNSSKHNQTNINHTHHHEHGHRHRYQHHLHRHHHHHHHHRRRPHSNHGHHHHRRHNNTEVNRNITTNEREYEIINGTEIFNSTETSEPEIVEEEYEPEVPYKGDGVDENEGNTDEYPYEFTGSEDAEEKYPEIVDENVDDMVGTDNMPWKEHGEDNVDSDSMGIRIKNSENGDDVFPLKSSTFHDAPHWGG